MELFLYSPTRFRGMILIRQTGSLNLCKGSSAGSLITYGLDDGGIWVRLMVNAETLVFLTLCVYVCVCVCVCVAVF